VQLEDVCPTILEATGCAYPEPPVMGPHHKGKAPALPGRSLLPWCQGRAPSDWRDCAYAESYNNLARTNTRDWARTVRTAGWRYTLYPEGKGEQLFDLGSDPDETRNLASDPASAEVRAEMRDRLLELVILQDFPNSPRERFAFGVH
jgi:arylsulfatase A-like enzyme